MHLVLQCFSHTSQHIRYKKKDFTFHEIFSNRLLDESKEGVLDIREVSRYLGNF